MTELLAVLLTHLATSLGGNMGLAILAASITLRLLMLPLSLKVARRRHVLARLQPELTRLAQRYQDDPWQLASARKELYRQHGQGAWPWAELAMLAQLPLVLGLSRAIAQVRASRFLWIADLARPDLWLVAICALVALVSGPKPNLVPAVLTAFFLWRLASGAALYSLGSALVGLLQGRLERRAVALGRW